jgi:hypothetical protein
MGGVRGTLRDEPSAQPAAEEAHGKEADGDQRRTAA